MATTEDIRKIMRETSDKSLARARNTVLLLDAIDQSLATEFLTMCRDGFDQLLGERGAKRVCRAHVTVFEDTNCVNCGEEVNDLPWLDGAVTVREDPSARK